MKPWLMVLAALWVTVAATVAGTITGTLRAQGPAGAGQQAAGEKYESRKFKFAERIDYAEMRDFVVYIDQPPASKPVPPASPVQVVTKKEVKQKGATFVPHVLPVLVDTTVEWPNNDDIFHNVFSISETKDFDLDLYKHPTIKSVKFDKKGRVDVFCSIHKDMHCVILVLENPFFAATDEKNRYWITNVPPGTYRLKAWHERMPSQVKEVAVPEQGETKVDFALSFPGLRKK